VLRIQNASFVADAFLWAFFSWRRLAKVFYDDESLKSVYSVFWCLLKLVIIFAYNQMSGEWLSYAIIALIFAPLVSILEIGVYWGLIL
jgi:hypothetical protein